MSSIACTGCGATINPEADPSFCPICGSEDRQVAAHDAAALKVYEDIRLAKRKHPRTKPHEKIWVGHSPSETGEQNWRKRVVDRDQDRYYERVEAPDGTVIHQSEEPLSKHRGHGAARDAKRAPKGQPSSTD